MESTKILSFIGNLPWWLAAIVVVGGFMSLSLLVLRISRIWVTPEVLKSSHDVAGFTFGIMGVIYGVLLGFTVVEANGHFHEAEQDAVQEAAILSELFRDASVFPQEEQDKLRKILRAYAVAVHDEEWKSMSNQLESHKARELYDQIWETYANFNPQAGKQSLWYQQSLNKLNDLSAQRMNRLYTMQRTLGPLMWTLLIAGGIVTVSFMCFFFAESQIAQSLMTLFLSGTIAFMLFLIMSLEGIYTGDIRVVATPLQKTIERFDGTLLKKAT